MVSGVEGGWAGYRLKMTGYSVLLLLGTVSLLLRSAGSRLKHDLLPEKSS